MNYVYFALFAIGFFGLLFSFISGDYDNDTPDVDNYDLSSDNDAPKIFSMRIMFASALAFAIGGSLGLTSGHSIIMQMLYGIISSIIVGYLTYKLMKFLYSQQSNSIVSSNSLIGKSAIVTIPNSNVKTICQIQVKGFPEELIAINLDGEHFQKGDIVKIIDVIGTRVIVSKP